MKAWNIVVKFGIVYRVEMVGDWVVSVFYDCFCAEGVEHTFRSVRRYWSLW